MKFRVPAYYENFKCISSDCSDNCCIGWEIDIDSKTYNFYKSQKGILKEKLNKSIEGDPPHFILTEHERCPFLNQNNLCEIIINFSDKGLCQICSDHPRYYEWFDKIKEGGLGLCCEAAAKLIMTNNAFSVSEFSISDECYVPCDIELFNFLSDIREKFIKLLENDSIPFGNRIAILIDSTLKLQENIDNGDYSLPKSDEFTQSVSASSITDIVSFFETLEPINEEWTTYISNIKKLSENLPQRKNEFLNVCPYVIKYLQNIAIYFLWRYFLKGTFDGEIISRVGLTAVSVLIIGFMFYCQWLETGILSLNDCIILAKNYSKEIEYSEENINIISDAFYEDDFMRLEKLKGFFI